MENMLKALVTNLVPVIVNYLMDNKHLMIDFLKDEAAKSTNKIDDYVVGIIDEWLDGC